MNFAARLEKLRIQLHTLPCDSLLIEHPIDIFYLTGLQISAGKIVITEKRHCLIVDGRYVEYCKQQMLFPILILEKNTLAHFLQETNSKCLGFDQQRTTYQRFLELKELLEELNKNINHFEIIPIPSPLTTLRLIKDPDEIECLRTAAQLGFKGYEFATSLLKEGITEAEIALELEFFWKKLGAERLAFDSIVAFGANSSMPHYRAGNKVLEKNMPVLLDIGVVLNHYHSDMTRVVFFGEVSEEIQKIYTIVEEAKNLALSSCRPGTLVRDLDTIARDWIESKGYGNYFTHSLGHGVGLDIHESPLIRKTSIDANMPLKEGMVMTIEPGIYLPSIGGVRLEDTIVINKNGYENFYV